MIYHGSTRAIPVEITTIGTGIPKGNTIINFIISLDNLKHLPCISICVVSVCLLVYMECIQGRIFAIHSGMKLVKLL